MTAPRSSPGARDAAIGALGLVLLAIYGAATVRMLLWDYFPSAGLTVDWIKMLGPTRRWPVEAYLIVALGSFAAYAGVLALARPSIEASRSPVRSRLLVAFPLLFALVLVPMYPPTAVDLFHYHADARTFWVYGLNPLIVPPEANPYPIGISWADLPSPYGPGWSILTGLLAPLMIFGDHHIATLLGFKVLAALAYGGCAWLIYRIVSRVRPEWALFALVLFAWNPFVLLRIVGNGHNDVMMILAALATLERAQARDWTLAFPLLACSVLVKYVTGIVGLPLLIYAWSSMDGDARTRARALAPGVAIAALVVVLAYLPFWAGLDTFDGVLRQGDLIITSTPDLLHVLVRGRMGEEAAMDLARRVTLLLFVALVVPLSLSARRGFDGLVAASVNLLFVYLVLAAGWFRPWYMLWPATLVVLRPTGAAVALFLAIAFGNTFPDLIEQYRYDWGIPLDLPLRSAPVAAQFALPVLVWLVSAAALRSFDLGPREEGQRAGGTPVRGDAPRS